MKRTYQVSSNVADKEKALKELNLGYLNLEDQMFEQARLSFEIVLQYDPKCADAYWGLMLAKFQLPNENDLTDNAIHYKTAIYLPEYENAMKYADKDQKRRFDDMMENIYKINAGDDF